MGSSLHNAAILNHKHRNEAKVLGFPPGKEKGLLPKTTIPSSHLPASNRALPSPLSIHPIFLPQQILVLLSTTRSHPAQLNARVQRDVPPHGDGARHPRWIHPSAPHSSSPQIPSSPMRMILSDRPGGLSYANTSVGSLYPRFYTSRTSS